VAWKIALQMAALVPIAEFADTFDAGRINVIVLLGQQYDLDAGY
jgi:hypothetical protein